MKRYNVLSVCGSGTVTSSMVAEKLRETLEEKGYIVDTTEANPNEALLVRNVICTPVVRISCSLLSIGLLSLILNAAKFSGLTLATSI